MEKRQHSRQEATMKKIMIATDGSANSTEAVGFGVELAAEHGARVVFVHVAPALDTIPMLGYGMGGALPRVRHELDAVDRAPLEDAEQIAAHAGVEATSKLLTGNAADEIVAYADSQSADLIVVGSRGHGTLAGMLLGSVSLEVLSQSKRPVAVIRGLTAVPVEA
jgi:nucleotide-binding universal stress UspA family protein